MLRKIVTAAVLAALVVPVAASADTLYQAAPPPAGPGHPLRLGADHRAQQIGDLVYIIFDFSDSNSHTANYTSSKSAGFTLTGLFHIPAISGSTNAASAKSATGADSFVSTMMATVTNVLPSGVLAIAGDQGVIINGRQQTLHITGFIRPEDLDFTDAVLSSRVANVQANFNGDNPKGKGLIQRILEFLF
ncbi:MAG: flagellar basal body L-ring protein FlgH [Candidatus Eremiobacteraeota bacterium]|nr:flagellar basal body L-ring protein FlgH [Candidatus Eremiobacteraeota bacterium]MBV8285072.1 flagellar basal body L-ring protein FlgH [Candidatus Eremiobacteraeota bacterium]